MFAVRYVALATLVAWLGGMILLALIVTPSTLRVLLDADPIAGRLLAGRVLGDILWQFHLLAVAGGALLLVCLFVMKFVGPPPRGFVIRAAIVSGMLAVTLYSGVRVARERAQLQQETPDAVSALPERHAGLHRTSTGLLTVNMVLGLVLLFWYVRE
jgi:hypothetical protein